VLLNLDTSKGMWHRVPLLHQHFIKMYQAHLDVAQHCTSFLFDGMCLRFLKMSSKHTKHEDTKVGRNATENRERQEQRRSNEAKPKARAGSFDSFRAVSKEGIFLSSNPLV